LSRIIFSYTRQNGATTFDISEMIEPSPRHWDIVRRLRHGTGTTGPRTPDAWLAALAIENGCEWITMDRDFGRFPELRWDGPSQG
jgi:predicted nucleic acid-binding protein